MPFIVYLAVAVAAYLLGSIPFGYVLVRVFRKEDIREKGSGNIGATNVIRSGAKGLGAATFLLDVLKGFVAVMLCGAVMNAMQTPAAVRMNAVAVAALFAILGHMFTVWLGFKGGKGVATAFGVFLALAPWAALAGLGIFIIVFALSRYVSLASIIAAAAFPVIVLLLHQRPRTAWSTAVLFLIPFIVIVRHRQNIARLLSGTEYRFGKTRTTAA
ncbi:MAG TPA: glycerol-3-phosphate 1-O-acyltransferase PlsY [Acidobacteriaceae bacterium]|nr:glycerol-3-phosphate 1-O-acyltransferase PlsY [Acidobacteriaceae bacterium]